MTILEQYIHWLAYADGALREELVSLEGSEAELTERFCRELEFGTGGLRGIMGAGANRMNLFTVGKATQGLCNYLNGTFENPSAAVCYDSRLNSELFAKHTAAVFAANGIRTYIYSQLMPTPALSYAVRALRCSAGVMITASHNPAEYNGYKVYGPDGCQITTLAAERIQREINRVDCFEDVVSCDFSDLLVRGMISYIGEDTAEAYLSAVDGLSLSDKDAPRHVSVTYTPLNGTGIRCVPRCLAAHGFTDVTIPSEQGTPDGRFPTCPKPNPELREALEIGLRTAREHGSDILLATDPDCDRVGVAVRSDGDYVLLTGNEVGVLLFEYVCRRLKETGRMPERPVAVKTIVTTPMAEVIAEAYGVELRNVLTGFKYIGEQIGELEQAGETDRFIFGFEESCGYLSGSHVRDKDGVNASLLICELAAECAGEGKTLADALNTLYERFGIYRTALLSYDFPGEAGREKLAERMRELREEPPAELAGEAVTAMTDYSLPGTGLPLSDVLRFRLNGADAVVRPSGTEPKLKVYLTAWGNSGHECEAVLQRLTAFFDGWIKE